ncbi:MAG: ParB N-terminal domain-containing protein [Oscillibacter sp.]|nr:ParB N-terminal domain-containing protein [Oscillibacter sp.]
MKIAINEIKVSFGRREVSLSGIDELVRSISEIGLLNPITVDPNHTLITGLHRLEAAKRLGWTEIECTVCGLEGLQAELAEIDENVVRTALSTIEYGELLERRKEIYESLHPETKAGLSQAAGMNRATGKHVSDKMSPTSKSFAQDTATKLGVSARTVERTMQTMKGLTQETRDVFHNFPNYKLSQSDAARLSRLDPAKQKTAAILLASGQIRSVDEYEPEPGSGKSTRKRRQSKEFLESVAELKDPTKRVTADPEIFLSEYHAMVYHIQQQIRSYYEPYSVENISSLSQPDIDKLQSLTDSCCEMMQDFVRQVREGKWQQHD